MYRFVLVGGCGLLIHSAALAQNSSAAQNPPPAAQASGSSSLAHALNKAFGDVYEKVSPGVVVIEAAQAPRPQPQVSQSGPLLFLFQDPDAGQRAMNQGSGFLITPDGYILTNSHVLEGASAHGLTVTLKDGRKFEAKVAGIDETSDLAVLKINASGLPVVQFGDSDAARVGEFAFALGAPYDLRYTFTYGIISAKGRTDLSPTSRGNYEEYIQTDAAINPGNSGGPLVDCSSRLLGINTAIATVPNASGQAGGGNVGLGFAIPVDLADRLAGELIADGRVNHPSFGLEAREVVAADGTPGLFVARVVDGGPADEAGLRAGDIITAVDGASAVSVDQLTALTLTKGVGDEVEVAYERDGRSRTTTVTLARL